MSTVADDPITYTCALETRRETVYFLARLIHEHCARLGTRVLGPSGRRCSPCAGSSTAPGFGSWPRTTP